MENNDYQDLPGFTEILESKENDLFMSLVSPAMNEGEGLEEVLAIIFPGNDLHVTMGANYGTGFIHTVPDADRLLSVVNELNSELDDSGIDPVDMFLVYVKLGPEDTVEAQVIPVWERELEEEGTTLDDALLSFGDPLDLEEIRNQAFI